jgi:hypothetical protein
MVAGLRDDPRCVSKSASIRNHSCPRFNAKILTGQGSRVRGALVSRHASMGNLDADF